MRLRLLPIDLGPRNTGWWCGVLGRGGTRDRCGWLRIAVVVAGPRFEAAVVQHVLATVLQFG